MVTQELHDKLRRKSDEFGITMSALSAIAITEWFEAKSMALTLEQILEMKKIEDLAKSSVTE
jgi:hypothetical protein